MANRAALPPQVATDGRVRLLPRRVHAEDEERDIVVATAAAEHAWREPVARDDLDVAPSVLGERVDGVVFPDVEPRKKEHGQGQRRDDRECRHEQHYARVLRSLAETIPVTLHPIPPSESSADRKIRLL